jgi:hypothetical protein
LLNAGPGDWGHEVPMAQTSTINPIDEDPSEKIAERLRAQARLCRHIASQSWNEDVGAQLEELAQLCLRAAGTAGRGPRH